MKLPYSSPQAECYPVCHQNDVCQSSAGELKFSDGSDILPDYGWKFGNDL